MSATETFKTYQAHEYTFFLTTYHKIANFNMSRLGAHAHAYEGDFEFLGTMTFWQTVYFLISNTG